MNAEQFGRSIKAARLKKGWTRKALSDRTGVRSFSVYCIEEEFRADKYPVDECRKLAEVLGVRGIDK